MISPTDISTAASRVLAQYDVSEAYSFSSFARGEQTPDSDIDLRLICGNTMTFGTLYELSMSSRGNLGERLISSPTHQSTCARHSAKALSKMRCVSMKLCKQDEALVCSGVISKSEFCRILPDSASLRSQY